MENTKTQQYRVLLADDDSQLQEEFRETYRDFFIISGASSQAEALEKLSQERYDAVVTGWYPEGFDGIEIAGDIRSYHPDLFIFFYFREPHEDALFRASQVNISAYFMDFSSVIKLRSILVNSVRNAVQQRKSKELATPESEILENIIQVNPYSISVYDKDGRLLNFNKAYLDLFTVPMPQELTVFTLGIFQGDTEYQEVFERMKRGETIRSSMREYSNKKNHPLAPGKTVHIGATSFNIKDKQGNIQYFVIMHEDMTEQVNAEEKLKKAHEDLQKAHADLTRAHEELKKHKDELEERVRERTAKLTEVNREMKELVKERKKMADVLEKKNRELEDFAGRISHDMKNSLLMLRRIIELSPDDPAQARETLKRLSERSDQLMDFVESLLKLAKAGKVIDRHRVQSLDPFIQQAFTRIKPQDVNGELIMPQKLPPVYGDGAALENVFINLLRNSFSHRDPEKETVRIEITGEEKPDNIEIRYRDNGKGIEAKHLEQIFDAGFTTKKKDHSGFGLSIIKKIIDAHGGSITVKSEGEGTGAQFRLILPRKGARNHDI